MKTTLQPSFCGSRKTCGNEPVAEENQQTSQTVQRDETVDIIKGILIILVVVGHYQVPFKEYIYWFHMPCFFMVSGFFLKECKNMDEVKVFVISKFKRLMIPYISYLLVFGAILFIQGSMAFDVKSVVKLIYGGKLLGGLFSVFWFVTVLFISLIILSFLTYRVRSSNLLIFLMIAMYSLAHLEGMFAPLPGLYHGLPLGVDICLLAISYIWMGKILFQKKNYLRKVHILLAATGFVFLVLSNYLSFDSYILDMKPGKYIYWIYDMIVPVMCMVLLYALCVKLAGIKGIACFFSLVGRSSITIMFLHMAIIMVCRKILPSPWHFFVGIPIGVILLVIVHSLLKRFFISRYLFLGE